jgi:hypothetical protein
MIVDFYVNINFLIPFLLEKRNKRIIYIAAILLLVVASTMLNSTANKVFGINGVMATRAIAAIQPN